MGYNQYIYSQITLICPHIFLLIFLGLHIFRSLVGSQTQAESWFVDQADLNSQESSCLSLPHAGTMGLGPWTRFHCCLVDGGHNTAAGFCMPHLALIHKKSLVLLSGLSYPSHRLWWSRLNQTVASALCSSLVLPLRDSYLTSSLTPVIFSYFLSGIFEEYTSDAIILYWKCQ